MKWHLICISLSSLPRVLSRRGAALDFLRAGGVSTAIFPPQPEGVVIQPGNQPVAAPGTVVQGNTAPVAVTQQPMGIVGGIPPGAPPGGAMMEMAYCRKPALFFCRPSNERASLTETFRRSYKLGNLRVRYVYWDPCLVRPLLSVRQDDRVQGPDGPVIQRPRRDDRASLPRERISRRAPSSLH